MEVVDTDYGRRLKPEDQLDDAHKAMIAKALAGMKDRRYGEPGIMPPGDWPEDE